MLLMAVPDYSLMTTDSACLVMESFIMVYLARPGYIYIMTMNVTKMINF